MNDVLQKLQTFLNKLSLSQKISMAVITAVVVAGLVVMLLWTNQPEYRVLFNSLDPEDGGAIVEELRKRNVAYRVSANAGTILVPAEHVYELRLALAGQGLPKGGQVGFEIFDQTDFRTTRFVEQINYRRALQGELARTINQFQEVKNSRVFIVIPKESVFLEERRPASASIQLELKSTLAPEKLAAIVHLVANAVEGLDPQNVNVVDTQGRVVFKGSRSRESTLMLNSSQLEYKRKVEGEIRANVESMLEGILGPGNAIVRVTAEIDFNEVSLNEEEYDPSTTVVRSEHLVQESTRKSDAGGAGDAALINQRKGILPEGAGAQDQHSKKDVATNYEINRITRSILKPAGSIRRLSVAAVINDRRTLRKNEKGESEVVYEPRTAEEMQKFEEIVQKAMGYNEYREDQVTVSSVAFAQSLQPGVAGAAEKAFDPFDIIAQYRKLIINLILIAVVFFAVVRPFLKSIKRTAETAAGPPETTELLEGAGEAPPQIEEAPDLDRKTRIIEISRENPEKTQQLIRSWIEEHGA